MLHLGEALYSKGFSITVIHTLFNSPNYPSFFPHFTFHFIPPKHPTGNSPMEVLSSLYTTCRDPFREALSRIVSFAEDDDHKVGCIVADSLWPFPRDVAEELNLTAFVLRCASASSFLAFDAIPRLLRNGYFSLPDAHLEDPVLELPPLRVKDLPPKATLELVDQIVRGVKNSHAVIWNSFEDLEGPALARLSLDLHIPIFAIGPLNKYSSTSAGSILSQDKDTIISWLNKQAPKSVLYVSFGSNSKLTEAELLEISWGLAESRVPFLFVVRAQMIQDSEGEYSLPHGFLEVVGDKGLIVDWAPQTEVLAHRAIGGFWTHGGWNSMMESISEGVPLICMPCKFPDQMINAAFASETWKIALRVEKGAKRDEIAKVIGNLMVEKAGEELRETAVMWKHKADRCLTKGGSSYELLERLTSFILSL